MGKVSFIPELNSRPNKEGLFSVMIRITKDRKIKRVNSGVYLKKADWNQERREVRKTCKNHLLYNSLIGKKIGEASLLNISNEISDKRISITSIQKAMKNEVTGGSFYDFANSYTAKIKNSGTRRVYITVINKLVEYAPKLDFIDITRVFILDYQNWLTSTKLNKVNTIYKNLGTIQAIYNEAIEQDVFEPAKNPWTKIRLKKEPSDRCKLTPEEIDQIEKAVIDSRLVMFHARNIFMMQYYSFGMRISDMLLMKWSDFDGERFRYKATKTDKRHGPKLPQQAIEILAWYKTNAGYKRNGYIFPFLKKYEWTDHHEYRREIEAKTSMVNNNMKELAKRLNINKNISSHVARHSFANEARKKTKDIYAISKALGHSNISTTVAYFANDLTHENDELSDLVY